MLEAVLRRMSSEASQPPIGLAATLSLPVPPHDPWSIGSREHAVQAGGEDALRYWDRMLLVLVVRRRRPDLSRSPAGLDPAPGRTSAARSSTARRCNPTTSAERRAAGGLPPAPTSSARATSCSSPTARGPASCSACCSTTPGGCGRATAARSRSTVGSPFYRTRHVAVLRPGRGVATAHHVASLHADPDTASLVAELVAETQHFIAATLPTPVIHYFGIDDDRAALHLDAPSVKSIAGVLTRPETTLARETIAQSFELDCAARITLTRGYTQRFDKPGNLDLAADSLQKAIQTDPGFALGYAQLGEVFRLKYTIEQNTHWLDEAQAYGQKAAELDNRIPTVFVTLAKIHDALGKHDLALQEFQHALQLDPKSAAALGGLARSYENSGRIAEAEKTFQDAAAMRPDNWYGYNELGAFYGRQGKYPQALTAYNEALHITPDNAEIYSNLAAAYLDAGGEQSNNQAEQALRKSIALSPSYPAYANLGLLYMHEKRYSESAGATEQALKLNGNNYLVWNNLMLAYEGAKQSDKAEAARRKTEELAEKVVQMKPQDAMAQSMLANLYAKGKQNEKAASKIRTSLLLAPDDPNVLSNIGEAYEFMGDREKALQYIGKSMQKGFALDDIVNDPSLQALIADPRFKAAGK